MRDQDPTRLRHELGTALEHALLSAGASNASSEETRRKTLAALGLASSATLLASIAGTSAVGSAATSAVKLGWAKVVLGVSALSAATGVPVGYYYVQQQKQVAAVRAAAVKPMSAPVRPVLAPPETPTPRPVAAPVVSRSARPASRGELTQELAALDRVRTTLAGGDARGALAALDAYDRGYPKGRLELEAEVLRIEALVKSGRVDPARERGESFLRRYPQSVLASRVRSQIRAGE
jgi:hypothetical protein